MTQVGEVIKVNLYMSCTRWKTGFNTIPNDKILDLSKFKAFADDNKNMD